MSNVTETLLNLTTAEVTKIDASAVPTILQFIFGFTGNVIALIVLVASSKRHRWRPFYRLVGGLAVTDLSGIILVYPPAFVRYGSDFTYDYPPELCGFVSFAFSFAFMSSAFIVCAMSFDRYLAIVHPFVYNSSSKERRTNLMLILIWLVTSFISILNIIGLGTAKVYFPGSWCFLNFISSDVKDRINTHIYSIVGLLILLATAILNAIVIGHTIRSSCNKTTKTKKSRQNDIYIIVLLFVVVAVFGICWTPLMLRMLVNANSENPQNGRAELLAVRLAITNSIVDPWIYILLRKENLAAVIRLVSRLRGQKLGTNNEKSTTNNTFNNTPDIDGDCNSTRDGDLEVNIENSIVDQSTLE